MILDNKSSKNEAKKYVLKKPIIRPKTTILSLVLFLLKTFLFGICFGLFVSVIVDIFFTVKQIYSVLIVAINIALVFLFSLKKVAVLCVECYQHYAPEEYRRLCLCKPTCSEYALIVLKKYNFIKAIYLIYIRLTKTCKNTYKIDFP